MGLFLRILSFLLIFALLILGIAEYTQSISEAVLSTMLKIQENGLQQEWNDIFWLIVMLAIPFFIFVFIYRLFMGAMMRYSHLVENGELQSLEQTGTDREEQGEGKNVFHKERTITPFLRRQRQQEKMGSVGKSGCGKDEEEGGA